MHSKLFSDFEQTETESTAIKELLTELHCYMFLRSSVQNTKNPTSSFIGMQQFFSVIRTNQTEKSNVQYLEVMDAVADTKDTMIALLHNLHTKYILQQHQEFLILEGDAKLFDIIQSLKHEYGDELRWVIPYPGDWHVLKNYQIALLKPYFDAGLKEMASAAGYPVAQIRSCGQFKRVHHFLLEAWEAIYRVMLEMFLVDESDEETEEPMLIGTTLSSNIKAKAVKFLEETLHQDGTFAHSFNLKLPEITELLGSTTSTEFVQFLQHMSSTLPEIKDITRNYVYAQNTIYL